MEGLQLDPRLTAEGQPTRGSALVARLRRLFEGPYLLLVAVGSVVVLVSLPLLRGLALRENERDAMDTLRLFGREVFAAPEASVAGLGALVEGNDALNRRLPDTRLVDDGRRLFRHGYLFELARTEGGEPILRAWPYSHGETGLAAFVLGSDGELYGHPNQAALWSGPASPPTRGELVGAEQQPGTTWRRLESTGTGSRTP